LKVVAVESGVFMFFRCFVEANVNPYFEFTILKQRKK
jgi:hypothetical protein